MAQIPVAVKDSDLTRLVSRYIPRIHQGKVRDTFAPPDSSMLLQLATDRISIFDFVLNSLIKNKGACLTAMTVFYLTEILKGVDNHLIDYGKNIDKHLPKELHGNPELQSRAIIVKKLEMLPIECIVRDYLTGTGYAAYKTDGKICGISLPTGLHDGSRIPGGPIFTPTTKAEEGHDEHISADSVDPAIRKRTIEVFKMISGYAESRNIILADSKFEFSKEHLGDEVATPDSSRYWLKSDWEKAQEEKRSPQGYDKQPVREFGKNSPTPFTKNGLLLSMSGLSPENANHTEWVHEKFSLHPEIADETARRYKFIFAKLIGMPLAEFQKKKMGIAI